MQLSLTSRKKRAGFSLIEVVLALGVVAAAVLALIGILGSTFASAREIALQHRAVNAVTQLDGAFQTAGGITPPLPGSATDPAFDTIYKALAQRGALDGKNFVDVFVYQKTQDKSPAVPVVFMPASGKFKLEEAKTPGGIHDGIDTSTVFRMRVRLSQLMKGKLYQLDKQTYEATPGETWDTGKNMAAKAPTPDDYALAYLPLSIEIYPHNFSDETDPGDDTDPNKALVKPILTQTVVINR